MSTVFECLLLEKSTLFTGSWLGSAYTVLAVQEPISSDSISTGSWFGSANTWGTDSSLVGTLAKSLQTGSWGGVVNTWGVRTLVTESYDRDDVTSDEFPIVNQSVGAGDWDPFPLPEPPAEPELPQRDVTRYRKTYSSQRHQVQRIRIVRK